MSCSLHYRPIRSGTYVGDSNIRNPIEAEFGKSARLDCYAIPFLRGLLHGSAEQAKGAKILIDAIEKHDEIEVFQKC